MLVSIDPGVKMAGVAIWDDNELVAAWLSKGTGWSDTARVVTNNVLDRCAAEALATAVIAIEKPQVYHQSKQKGDQADLIELAIAVGAITTSLLPWVRGGLVTYLPRAWKSQVPKDIMVERIKQQLSPEERARIDLPSAKGLHHNIYDAVGIGMFHLHKNRKR